MNKIEQILVTAAAELQALLKNNGIILSKQFCEIAAGNHRYIVLYDGQCMM